MVNLRKGLCSLVASCILACSVPKANAMNALTPAEQEEINDISGLEQPRPARWPGYVLLGADVVLGGLAINATLDQRSAAKKFNELHAQIDNTNATNYQKLLDEKKKVDGKRSNAAIFSIVAGLAVGYTVLDYFLLHKVFPENKPEIGYNPIKKETRIAFNYRF